MATTPVDQALARILDLASPPVEREEVDLLAARGRVLAADVTARCDLPPHDASAMDGFALRAADAGAEGLPVRERVVAGAAGGHLCPGTAVRIFTGAPVPLGADTVVAQEDCLLDARGHLHPQRPLAPGLHLRRAGESVRRGATVLVAGHRLRAQDIALAASVGVHRLCVARALRVAVITTGRELTAPGQPLASGHTFDANRYQLHALLEALGCEVRMQPAIGDEREVTVSTLAAAARTADVLVTSGGVGVGEEDHVHGAVEQLGEVLLRGVAMKPGKPVLFGRIGRAEVFGLPGNPAALLVAFALFVRPFVLRRLGTADVYPRGVAVRSGFHAMGASGRRIYLMARLEPADGDGPVCRMHTDRSSGTLAAASWAQGLAVVPEGARIDPGRTIEFLPFSDLLG